MKKSYVIILACFVLQAALVFGFSGEVQDGQTITVSDIPIFFKVDGSGKVYFEVDGSGAIGEAGDCEIHRGVEVCFGAVEYSHRNRTTFLDVYTAQVNAKTLSAAVSLDFSVLDGSLLIGEKTTGSLLIENTGESNAEGLEVDLGLPTFLKVSKVTTCTQTGNHLSYHFDMAQAQSKECEFELEALAGGSELVSVNATYFNGFETIDVVGPGVQFDVETTELYVNMTFPENISIGDEFNAPIEVVNEVPGSSIFARKVIVDLPPAFEVVKKPTEFARNDQLFTYSDTLEDGESFNTSFRLRAERTGNYTIPVSVEYRLNDFDRSYEVVSNAEVDCDCPYLVYTLKNTSDPLKKEVQAFIINPAFEEFRNLQFVVDSDLPGVQVQAAGGQSIVNGQAIQIFDSVVDVPTSGDDAMIELLVEYSTPFFQRTSAELSIPISVNSEVKETLSDVIVPEDAEIVVEETAPPTQVIETEFVRAIDNDEDQTRVLIFVLITMVVAILAGVGYRNARRKKREYDELHQYDQEETLDEQDPFSHEKDEQRPI